MTNKPLDQELLNQALKVAKQAAKSAEVVINQHYQSQSLETEVKSDATPVTIADKASEQVIRQCIQDAFPDHAIFGEEFGHDQNNDSAFLWLIDPIDGTKSFVREYPMFSTQIALMYQGELVMGVSNAPAFGEMAYAAQGQGAFLNDVPIQVTNSLDSASSCVSTGNVSTLIDENWIRLGQLCQKFSKIRGYGDFYHYHLLAKGCIDLVVESDVNILDIAALAVIVREAGGIFTDIDGKALDLETRSVLAGHALAHEIGLQTLS